jgi:hypothetical protein
MRVLNRRLAGLGCLVVVLALPPLTLADEPNAAGKQLAELVKSAHEQIAEIRNQLDQVEGYLSSSANATGAAGSNRGGAFATAGRGPFTDLDRAARSLADIGNRVVSFTSKCTDESHDVAVKFRNAAQRVRNGVSQIESGSSALAQMSMGKIRHDLEATEQQLQTVAGLSGNCS